ACHDLGKLDRTWQRWAREWQTLLNERYNGLYRVPDPRSFLAKTDFDYSSKEQRELQKTVKTKRPHHACESVMFGRKLIIDSLGIMPEDKGKISVLRAICGAIARHHSPRASNYNAAQIDNTAKQAIAEALDSSRQNQRWNYDLLQMSLIISEGGDLAPESASMPKLTRPQSGLQSELETWLYFVIVRALRLADQRAGIFS